MEAKAKVVWAKMQGYPWWPGKVIHKQEESIQIKDNKVYKRIRFIGDNT